MLSWVLTTKTSSSCCPIILFTAKQQYASHQRKSTHPRHVFPTWPLSRRIAAQRSGATTWSEVLNTTRAGTNSFNLSSTGRWRFRARAGTPSSWGDWSEATNLTVVGAPAAPGGFTASSPAAGVLSISFM